MTARSSDPSERQLGHAFAIGHGRHGSGARRQRGPEYGDDLLVEDELLGLVLRVVRLGAIVFDQHLERSALDASFVVDVLLGQQHPVSLRLTESGARPGERYDRTDLDGFTLGRLRPDWARREQRCDRGRAGDSEKYVLASAHQNPPLMKIFSTTDVEFRLEVRSETR